MPESDNRSNCEKGTCGCAEAVIIDDHTSELADGLSEEN